FRVAIVSKHAGFVRGHVISEHHSSDRNIAELIDDVREPADRAVQIRRAEVHGEIAPVALASRFDAPDPASRLGISGLAAVDNAATAASRREAENGLIVADIFVIGVELRAHMAVEERALPAHLVLPDLDRLVWIVHGNSVGPTTLGKILMPLTVWPRDAET